MDNKKNTYPKVLVISHNCFSKTGSNGRTLSNLFSGWPLEFLAQFYISNEKPDFNICNNYYRVTDAEAVKALMQNTDLEKMHLKTMDTNEINNYNDSKTESLFSKLLKIKKKKSPLSYILRNFVWDTKKWKKESFNNWVKEFKPEVILIQLGDYSFMLRIALEIAKENNIPIIIYNSEDYFFKQKKSISPLYYYYRLDYKMQFNKLITYASHSIYNSELLKETYTNEWKHKNTVIMNSTDMKPKSLVNKNSSIRVSYLGNLGVGRHQPLIEIAETFQLINQKIFVDIYGNIPNEEIKKALTSCKGIRLKGFVSYNEVEIVMKSSDILIHAENFSNFYKKELKHAFSTKIADSLASGTNFIVYAPANLACTRYLSDKNAAFVVNDSEKLYTSLKEMLNNNKLREIQIKNGIKTVEEYHSLEKNSIVFRNIIKKYINKEV